ncbi:MAG: PTS system nitrogen regulatory IIA component [Paraglaciecola sp.]|jgi:PTS system nitrogen regulatory IIA component
MEIRDILHSDCTLCAVQGTSKKRILELISQIANQHIIDIDQATILASLMCREKMGSTGIGCGIALPHGRLKDLEKVIAVLVTCVPAIPFDAIDNAPVDVFFAIFVPENQAQQHLQTLSIIASKLNDKDILKKMRSASNDQELFKVIS